MNETYNKKEKLQELLSKPLTEVFTNTDMKILLENLNEESKISTI